MPCGPAHSLRHASLGLASIALSLALGACLHHSPGNSDAQVETLIGDNGLGQVCELSLDCPEGYHCDLKVCARACREDAACDDAEVCSPRGRCLDAGQQDRDPKPRTDNATLLTGPDTPVTAGFGKEKVSFRIHASTDERISYRLDSRVPWLEAGKPRGKFEGELHASLRILKRHLEPGINAGTVLVHTPVGSVTVPVRVTKPKIRGRYAGNLRYHKPLPLGVLRLELGAWQISDTEVALRIDPKASPSFAEREDFAGLMTIGTIEDGRLTAEFRQHLKPEDLSNVAADDNGGATALPWKEVGWHPSRELMRRLTIDLQLKSSGALRGKFSDRVVNLAPEEIKVNGKLELKPVSNLTRDEPCVAKPDGYLCEVQQQCDVGGDDDACQRLSDLRAREPGWVDEARSAPLLRSPKVQSFAAIEATVMEDLRQRFANRGSPEPDSVLNTLAYAVTEHLIGLDLLDCNPEARSCPPILVASVPTIFSNEVVGSPTELEEFSPVFYTGVPAVFSADLVDVPTDLDDIPSRHEECYFWSTSPPHQNEKYSFFRSYIDHASRLFNVEAYLRERLLASHVCPVEAIRRLTASARILEYVKYTPVLPVGTLAEWPHPATQHLKRSRMARQRGRKPCCLV